MHSRYLLHRTGCQTLAALTPSDVKPPGGTKVVTRSAGHAASHFCLSKVRINDDSRMRMHQHLQHAQQSLVCGLLEP